MSHVSYRDIAMPEAVGASSTAVSKLKCLEIISVCYCIFIHNVIASSAEEEEEEVEEEEEDFASLAC
jgi:hypothetical protein